MTPIQQLMLGVGGAKKTYMDDLFSTYLYTGNNSTQSFNTGIDLAGDGGLLWITSRSLDFSSSSHILLDTVRGANKTIKSDTTAAEATLGWGQTFTSTGFTLNNYFSETNGNSETYASWSFRKAKGFFDVVTYTGNGSNRTISHSLGSVPGMIMVKRLDSADSWVVYHRDLKHVGTDSANSGYRYVYLNTNQQYMENSSRWNNTEPTASVFSVGTDGATNADGGSYVAYVFAGGESTQNEAVSVDMDGTGDYINTTSSSSDFTMGTGDFTVEGWFKCDNDNTNRGLFQISPVSGGLTGTNFNDTISVNISTSSYFRFNANGGAVDTTVKCEKGQWYHVALVRNSGTTSLYINGLLAKSNTDTNDYDGTYIAVSGYWDFGYVWDGPISNFRVVKGTAVYTSLFRPPTKPLTNISGTVLLCCNDSSVTGSTVTPVTLNSQGDPTASTDSPFDDPAGFVFGDAGDQGVVKCGSYVGNGSATGPEVYVGFEPQYILIKNTSSSGNWMMWDVMRGISTENDSRLYANSDAAESYMQGGNQYLNLTTTGFEIKTTESDLNTNGDSYIFLALRRADGYVGKPIEDATKCFAMDTGAASSTIPNFDSGFPVDFAIFREPASQENWDVVSRLIYPKSVKTNTTVAQSDWWDQSFDSNVGFSKHSGSGSNHQAWMWKRHAGFDVVTYKGNWANSHSIPHSMNKIPEMIWVKNRDDSDDWAVYHKGLNGGTNPEQYYLQLNNANGDSDLNTVWSDTAPTSTHFTVGANVDVNNDAEKYIAMLFSSVSGISKCGYFTGTGASGNAVTTGFQPRFILIKGTSGSRYWAVFDTVRGLTTGSGNDKRIYLDEDAAQSEGYDWIDVSSTGFTSGPTVSSYLNTNGANYIYYAHA